MVGFEQVGNVIEIRKGLAGPGIRETTSQIAIGSLWFLFSV